MIIFLLLVIIFLLIKLASKPVIESVDNEPSKLNNVTTDLDCDNDPWVNDLLAKYTKQHKERQMNNATQNCNPQR